MHQLKICVGTACHLNGANNVLMTFRHLMEEHNLYEKLELSAMFCGKSCANKDVAVMFDEETFRIDSADARKFFLTTILPKLEA